MRDAALHHGASKRRVLDEDVRDEVAKRARNKKASAQAVGDCAVKDGLSLKCAETEDLPGYMVASWNAYANEDLVLSAAYDASRLGSPLEDTQLYGRRARAAPGGP